MCGHGSITFLTDTDTSKLKVDEATSALIKSLQSRGRHATGLMQANAEGVWSVQKAPVDGDDFNKGRAPVRSDARAVAVHTRWATKGAPEWNRNNHPVAGSNGVLVMHNGVVRDYSLKRSQGDPEVDTFIIASTLGAMRKRGHNEYLTSFAKRMVKTAAEVDGSMTLQLAIRGVPLLVSCKIRSNPLYFAEAEGVRITASTYEAVRKAFDAIGVDLPMQSYEYTTIQKGKAKRGKTGQDRVVTHAGMQASIFEALPGELLVWSEGVHDSFQLGVLNSKSSYTPSVASSASPYVTPRAIGGYTPPPQDTGPPLKQGDRVKQRHTGRVGYVTSVEKTRVHGLQWYVVQFMSDKTSNGVERQGYQATITSANIELIPDAASSDPPTSGATSPATPSSGVVSVAGELSLIGDTAKAEFETLQDKFFELLDTPRSPAAAEDACEICGATDPQCREVEEVLMCQTCQAIQWESA